MRQRWRGVRVRRQARGLGQVAFPIQTSRCAPQSEVRRPRRSTRQTGAWWDTGRHRRRSRRRQTEHIIASQDRVESPCRSLVFHRPADLVGLLLGLLASGLALVASAAAGRGLEDQTYDWRLRATARPADARPDIALILINESSLRALEPNFGGWPWPRLLHAGVLDFLTRAHARVVAYDVLFLERDRRTGFDAGGRQMSGAESDAELVAAVRRAGNVVLLADAVFEGMEADAASTTRTPNHRRQIFQASYFDPAPGLSRVRCACRFPTWLARPPHWATTSP